MGIIEEHHLGAAFEEALPFTGLLVVFFVVVAMIHDQHLFTPIIDWALTLKPENQPSMFYLANGILSMISDNVFVATVYIGEVKQAFDNGAIDREQFEKLAIAINTGTNLPSVATPNGQAAFLFLLTSSIAPLIGLSYGKNGKDGFPIHHCAWKYWTTRDYLCLIDKRQMPYFTDEKCVIKLIPKH